MPFRRRALKSGTSAIWLHIPCVTRISTPWPATRVPPPPRGRTRSTRHDIFFYRPLIVVRARLAGVTCSPFRLQLRLTIQRPPAPAFLRIASARRRARSRSADLLASDAPRPCDGLSESRSRPSRRAAARARASLLAFAAALMRQPPAAVLSRTALLVRADGSSDRADLGRNDRVDSPDECADEGRNDRPDSPD